MDADECGLIEWKGHDLKILYTMVSTRELRVRLSTTEIREKLVLESSDRITSLSDGSLILVNEHDSAVSLEGSVTVCDDMISRRSLLQMSSSQGTIWPWLRGCNSLVAVGTIQQCILDSALFVIENRTYVAGSDILCNFNGTRVAAVVNDIAGTIACRAPFSLLGSVTLSLENDGGPAAAWNLLLSGTRSGFAFCRVSFVSVVQIGPLFALFALAFPCL